MRWRLGNVWGGPFGKKQPRGAAPAAKLRCVVAFNAQSGKAIFRKNADPAELARYVMTVLQGMAVQGEPTAPVPINYVESRKWHCARGRCVSLNVAGR